MCEKYNGWSNYPTWCVKLWIDNDQGLQQEVSDMAQSCIIETPEESPVGQYYHTKKERVIFEFESELKDFILELGSLPETGILSDLTQWVIDIVDWREIARAIIDDEIEEDSDIEDYIYSEIEKEAIEEQENID